jgi:predicted phage replisome organizer
LKGIEWIKITTNMCEDEKIKLFYSIEGVGDTGFYVWIRFLTQAGKVNDNGLIYLKPTIPYTKQMLARIFERPLDAIEKVIKVLVEFQMIEIYEDGIIKICNWEKHQNIEGMKKVREGTRERVKNCRERQKEKELLKEEELEAGESTTLIGAAKAEELSEGEINNNSNGKNKSCNTNVTLQRENREEDTEIKKKKVDKKEREEIDKQALKVMGDLEKINKNIKGLSVNWVKDMLTIHEEKYVKMAIGKALEKNKLDTNYINGILNNWFREGYPKTYEEMEFNACEGGKLDIFIGKPPLRFNNFEGRHYDYEDLEKKLLGWK